MDEDSIGIVDRFIGIIYGLYGDQAGLENYPAWGESHGKEPVAISQHEGRRSPAKQKTKSCRRPIRIQLFPGQAQNSEPLRVIQEQALALKLRRLLPQHAP